MVEDTLHVGSHSVMPFTTYSESVAMIQALDSTLDLPFGFLVLIMSALARISSPNFAA
jgi:hypothetical protein